MCSSLHLAALGTGLGALRRTSAATTTSAATAATADMSGLRAVLISAVLWPTHTGTGRDADGTVVHRNNALAALRNVHGENMRANHVVAPLVATATTRDAHLHQAFADRLWKIY